MLREMKCISTWNMCSKPKFTPQSLQAAQRQLPHTGGTGCLQKLCSTLVAQENHLGSFYSISSQAAPQANYITLRKWATRQ